MDRPPLTIHAERCAHTRLNSARCEACVQACPTAAWSIDDDGLAFDTDRCDRCGLCVVACPLEALALDAPALRIDSGQPRTLWLACERTPGAPANDPGQPACLHGLPALWLQQQAQRHHASRIACSHGDCEHCERQPPAEQRLPARWVALLRRQRGPTAAPAPTTAAPPTPQLVFVSPAEWQQQARRLAAPDTSRRRFFSRWLEPAAALGAGTAGRMDSGRLAEVGDGPLPGARWTLDWDQQRCTWCLVCARLCPTGAIHTAADGPDSPRQALVLQPGRCSGCGMCSDGCDQAALALRDAEPEAAEQRFTLQRLRCSRCQVDHWRLAGAGPQYEAVATAPDDRICPTCRQGKPHWQARVVQPAS